jgi:hypothetical protein
VTVTNEDLVKLHERGELSGSRFANSQVSNSVYHAGPGVSSTQLATFSRSPQEYYWRYIERNPMSTNDDMILGSMVHCLILEPEVFDSQFAEINRSTNAGKEEYQNFISANPEGALVKRKGDFHKAHAIAAAVKGDSFASIFLTGGSPEVSYYATDPNSGLLIRCRVDYVCKPMQTSGGKEVQYIADIKTISSLDRIERQLADFRRDASAAMYCDIVKSVTGRRVNYIHVYVTTKEPFEVAVCQLASEPMNDDNLTPLQLGRRKYRIGLERLKWCMDNDIWPSARGFDWMEKKPFIESIDLPRWEYAKER